MADSTTTPFIFADEIDAITQIHDVTRKRMERRGLFPRRIHIAPRRIAWRRSEIEAWAADPEGYQTYKSQAAVRPATDLAEHL